MFCFYLSHVWTSCRIILHSMGGTLTHCLAQIWFHYSKFIQTIAGGDMTPGTTVYATPDELNFYMHSTCFTWTRKNDILFACPSKSQDRLKLYTMLRSMAFQSLNLPKPTSAEEMMAWQKMSQMWPELTRLQYLSLANLTQGVSFVLTYLKKAYVKPQVIKQPSCCSEAPTEAGPHRRRCTPTDQHQTLQAELFWKEFCRIQRLEEQSRQRRLSHLFQTIHAWGSTPSLLPEAYLERCCEVFKSVTHHK